METSMAFVAARACSQRLIWKAVYLCYMVNVSWFSHFLSNFLRMMNCSHHRIQLISLSLFLQCICTQCPLTADKSSLSGCRGSINDIHWTDNRNVSHHVSCPLSRKIFVTFGGICKKLFYPDAPWLYWSLYRINLIQTGNIIYVNYAGN